MLREVKTKSPESLLNVYWSGVSGDAYQTREMITRPIYRTVWVSLHGSVEDVVKTCVVHA